MPTECNPSLFQFAGVEGGAVVASFDGGRMTVSWGAVMPDRPCGVAVRRFEAGQGPKSGRCSSQNGYDTRRINSRTAQVSVQICVSSRDVALHLGEARAGLLVMGADNTDA